jgi:hypothetical protein
MWPHHVVVHIEIFQISLKYNLIWNTFDPLNYFMKIWNFLKGTIPKMVFFLPTFQIAITYEQIFIFR